MMITMWNAKLAQRFPHADHRHCVQKREYVRGFGMVPVEPAQCLDYHCHDCGKRSTVLGRHDCDPPAPITFRIRFDDDHHCTARIDIDND